MKKTQKPGQSSAPTPAETHVVRTKAARAERLAAELRANLKRRKAAARDRRAGEAATGDASDSEGDGQDMGTDQVSGTDQDTGPGNT